MTDVIATQDEQLAAAEALRLAAIAFNKAASRAVDAGLRVEVDVRSISTIGRPDLPMISVEVMRLL